MYTLKIILNFLLNFSAILEHIQSEDKDSKNIFQSGFPLDSGVLDSRCGRGCLPFMEVIFSQIHFIPYLHLSLSRVEIVLHIQKPCLMYLVRTLPILLNFFHFRFSFRREPYPRFFPTVASRTCSYI